MRRPYFLAAVAYGYIAWTFLPVAVVVGISLGWDPVFPGVPLNLGAYRAALHNAELRKAFLQSVRLAIGTVVIAVPMGTALGLSIAHLSRRPWRVLKAALLGLIALPHLELGVAFFYLVLFVVPVQLNTVTQLIGHVTIALPIVAVIVWIRVLYLDPSYEEQAADLGAPPWSALTRVLLPLCLPAIVAAAMVAFAASFNEVVMSQYLCLSHTCQTLPMILQGRGGVEVSPPVVAMGVMAMGLSAALLGLTVIVTRVFGYRRSR